MGWDGLGGGGATFNDVRASSYNRHTSVTGDQDGIRSIRREVEDRAGRGWGCVCGGGGGATTITRVWFILVMPQSQRD